MRAINNDSFDRAIAAGARDVGPDVTILMPCLNEIESLPHCIANAHDALAVIMADHGLTGEILIADNGSTDGSQALAQSLGARVVAVAQRGYGAALTGGGYAAHGRYIVMGDADGSYDFREGVAMVGRLAEGADLCMGSRFKGGIAPGAMPWKNRHIGNPALTGILNLFYGVRIGDAHCGLRAITRDAFVALRLTGQGMEFASEMVVKAALQGRTIVETPATLSPDLRDRAPHLRPWRDGWRHLRYLMMLSPAWLFLVPAMLGAGFAATVFGRAILQLLLPIPQTIGNYWLVAAGAAASLAHMAAIMGWAGQLHGVRAGYRRAGERTARLAGVLTLETMLLSGLALAILGGMLLAGVLYAWSARDYGPVGSVLPGVAGTLLVTLGVQTGFGGFLLAIVGGNEARFMATPVAAPEAPSLRLAA